MRREDDIAQQVVEAWRDAILQSLLIVIKASLNNWRAAAWLAKFLEDRRSRVYSYDTTPEQRELERGRRG